MPILVLVSWRVEQKVPLMLPIFLLWPLLYCVWLCIWIVASLKFVKSSRIKTCCLAMRGLNSLKGFRLRVRDESMFVKINYY